MNKETGRQPEQKQQQAKRHAYGLTGVSKRALDFIAPIKKTYEDRSIDRLLVSLGY